VGLPKPDLILFLQLQLVDAAARGEFGHERYENGIFQERALQCFQQLMRDTTLNWKVRPELLEINEREGVQE
jgi:dTMP kinase